MFNTNRPRVSPFRANPQEPCRAEELEAGLAYALRQHHLEPDRTVVRAIFDRAQEAYEDGRSFMTAAHREAREMRINKAEFDATLAAIGEMGRYRQKHPLPSRVVYHDFCAPRTGGPTPASRADLQHEGMVTAGMAALLDLGEERPIERRQRLARFGSDPN